MSAAGNVHEIRVTSKTPGVRVEVTGAGPGWRRRSPARPPFTIQARHGAKLRLRARARGHRDQVRSVLATSARRIVFDLPRRRRRPRRHAGRSSARRAARTGSRPPAARKPSPRPARRASPRPAMKRYGEDIISPYD
jgi:hypothetical protein